MEWMPRELTEEDVRQVLAAHGLPTDEQAMKDAMLRMEHDRIDDGVYSYAYECTPDEQTPVVLFEVEELLRDWGIVPRDAPQKFTLE